MPIPNHHILLPGPALSTIDQVDVANHPPPPDPGLYYITTVYRRSATLWWALRALVQRDWDLTSEVGDTPQSQSAHSEESEHEILRRVCYHTCGLEPPLVITILDLTDDSPLRGQVEAGDRLVQLAGQPLRAVAQVRELLQKVAPGQSVTLLLHNAAGQPYRIDAIPKPIRGLSEEKGLGVLLSAHEDGAGLPKIRFQSGAYQGNSSDLALGLDICERLLHLNLRRSRKVAGTGGLAMDGSLTSVQGLRQKYYCARTVGADVFFVPGSDVGQLQGTDFRANRPQIVAVRSLSEAIQWLQKARH